MPKQPNCANCGHSWEMHHQDQRNPWPFKPVKGCLRDWQTGVGHAVNKYDGRPLQLKKPVPAALRRLPRIRLCAMASIKYVCKCTEYVPRRPRGKAAVR
jgi:hypothetical protein